MDWSKYTEEFKEDYLTGKNYRDQMVADINSFISFFNGERNKQKAQYITPSKLANNREKYLNDFINMLGFPLTEYANLPYGNKVNKTTVFENEKYIYSRMQIEVFPNYFVYGILAEHKDGLKRPFVLAQHGGEGTPEIVNGFVYNTANYNHLVTRILNKGANVFAMQTFLWNIKTYGTEYNREDLDGQLRSLGGSITALEIFMLKRVLDYFETKPFVDKDRIGMAGLSYGGMYTLFTTACDSRIKSAYSSCFFSDRTFWHRPDWSYKGMLSMFNDAEVAGLIAPRAVYIEVGSDDATCSPKGAELQVAMLKEYFAAQNAQDKLVFNVFNGTHELSITDEGFDFLFKNL